MTGFIALKFILQAVLIDPAYELHREEFLHLGTPYSHLVRVKNAAGARHGDIRIYRCKN